MKIIVTTRGTDVSAAVEPSFGRAPGFILYDTESGITRLIDNAESVNAAHGAGTKAALMASSLGAHVVLTGSCGPKARQTLEAGGVQVVEGVRGSVDEAIQDFRRRAASRHGVGVQ